MGFKEIKPATDEDWLELRTRVITATDMGVLLGLNKWKSVAQLIEGKENFEPFENSYTWLGQTLEPVVVTATNKVMNRDFKLFENGSRSFFIDQKLRLGATPDAGDNTELLECKSTKPGNFLRWAHWPPAYYISQLYTQLMCTGRQSGYLAIMSTDLTQQSEKLDIPLNVFILKREPEMDKVFLETVREFWEARDKGKVYRVNRKRVPILELQLRMMIRKVYGK